MNWKNDVISKVGVLGLISLWGAPSVLAQGKPAETTSKIKKVLIYEKIGGWRHDQGIPMVNKIIKDLGTQKGYTLDVVTNESQLTLANLQKYQVIIWNNNTDGAKSVQSEDARKAVLEYVNAGGGWLLIHGAGDHGDTWAELRTAMGTKFTNHGAQGLADAIKDPDADKDPETKFIVQDLPATARFKDEWYGFQNTVRGVSGVTVLYTAKNGETVGGQKVLVEPADGKGDYTYTWARKMNKGRLLYTALGHGVPGSETAVSNFIPKFYYEAMRYVAGDFQAGCTNKAASNYDSLARVDNASCLTSAIHSNSSIAVENKFSLVKGNQRFQVKFDNAGGFQVNMRDVKGSVVWSKAVSANTSEVVMDKSVQPGVYYLEVRNGKSLANSRLVIQ
jgi:uncharacterized protein